MKLLLLALLGCACAFAQTTPIYGGRTIQGGVNVFTTSGTANALIGTMPAGGTITSYASGAIYSTGALSASNTGTSGATLNIDGVGAKAIKQADGTTDVAAGTLVAGAAASFLYNGTAFQYLGGGGASSSSPGTIGPAVSASAPMYLYSHFRSDDPSLYLSYSFDGLNFKTMNASSMWGTNAIRDPSILYLNGTFYFVSTNGATGSWTYWTSTDLIHFTALQTIAVTGLGSSTVTWAPDWFTDPATGNIYAVGSAIIGGVAGIYKAPWTPGGGFGTATQITVTRTHPTWDLYDVQMQKIGSNYYIFFTEGPSPNHDPSQVVWATASTFTGTFTQAVSGNPTGIPALPSASSPTVPTQAEGETIYQIGTSSCYRLVADVLLAYRSGTSYNALPVDYHQEYTTTCDAFATFSAPQYFPISKGEQGTIIQITDPAVATVVLNAAAYWEAGAGYPGNLGVNTSTPRYTVEAKELGATGLLLYNPPASFAANSGNNVAAVWSACGTPGTFSPFCNNPPPSNGSWMMSSNTGGLNGQVAINNPVNGFSGITFMDQATQVGTRTTAGGGHAWWIGENWDSIFVGGSPTPNLHYFSFWDEQSSKTPLIMRGDTGEIHTPFALTIGTGNTNDMTNRVNLDSPSTGVLNCGNGTIADRSCTIRAGTLNVTATGAGVNPLIESINLNASFNGAVSNSGHMQTAARDYFSGLTGPSNTTSNTYYLFDGTNGYFAWTLHDFDFVLNANMTLGPKNADPGCTVDGKLWVDNSDASNTHLKACLKRSGALAWQTIN